MEDCRASQGAHCQTYQTRQEVGVEGSGHQGHHPDTHHRGQAVKVLVYLFKSSFLLSLPYKSDHHKAVAPHLVLGRFLVISLFEALGVFRPIIIFIPP